MGDESHVQLNILNETGFVNSLRRYLPRQQADAMIHQPSPATIPPCTVHLDALLRAVSTYLPRYLVAELLRAPQPGQVSGQFREATIMFADISGFTAMSERLAQRGKEGAEKITNIVGDYFTRMLDITARQGGDLLKFGGDALLVAFLGDTKAETVETGFGSSAVPPTLTTADHALHACRAAVQMQEAIARFSQVEAFGETFRLKMTAGLGSGQLFTANLGTVEKMEYTVMGEALANMAHAEDQAEGGEIFIDENTYQLVQPHVQVGEVRHGCHKLVHVSGDDLPGPFPLPAFNFEPATDLQPQACTLPSDADAWAALPHFQKTIADLDALVPFLPPGLLDLLRFDPTHMASREKGEFRPVTTMFANFYGIEEIISQLGPGQVREITAILQAHFSQMQEIIARYEGVVDKVDSYVVGHRIMALFGAPRAHVDDLERAVRAAWEMQTAMAAFGDLKTSAGTFALKQRIGINSGRVFAGNVGSETRHEYSVMGDEVNLTARLMSAAQEGQILISQSTATQVGKSFSLQEKEPVKVKGKSQPVPNYEVRGAREAWGMAERARGERMARRSLLIGRDAEWQAIWQVAQQAMQGRFQMLDVHGEMGMGKSRILEELIGQWAEQGGSTFFGVCLSYGRHTPYAPWTTILRDLFGLRDDDSEQERQEKIVGRLRTANPEWGDWAALIAQLLGVPMAESDLIKSLDPRLRQQNLQRIVTGLIASEAEYHPTLLILDDIQWIDEVSLNLLDYLTTHTDAIPALVCVAYRPEEPVKLASSRQPYYTAISLEPLSEASSMDLLNSQLPTDPEMPQRLKEMILKNAQGNPLFVVEMAHALIENYLCYDAESDVYRPRADLRTDFADHVQVPDTVSRVILSRLDRLDEPSRNLLKVASVIGRAFQQWLLQSVYPYQAQEDEIETHLTELCQKDLLDCTDVLYLFRHVMTREVAYESLLYAERRALHRKIAQCIEEQSKSQAGRLDEYGGTGSAEVLAEHYTLAEDWPQALACHIRAARRAQSIYANQDAIHRYRQVLDVATHVPDSLADQLIAYEGLGDIYELTGQYEESLKHYAQARTLLEHMPSSSFAQRYRADICRKTGHIYEYRGEYETALEWVKRGLALLGATEYIETARLYLGGAAVFQREGKWPEVIDWCQQSLDIVEQLSSEEGRQVAAHAYYLLGNSYRRLGETEKTRLYYERSLQTYQALGDQPGIARAYNNLATFYRYQDDWARATDYYQQAMAILERIGELHGQAVIANNLAEVLLNRGRLRNARIWYLQSLQISQELGLSFGVALLYNNLGYTAIRADDWAQALDYLQQSLDMFEKIGAKEFLPELYRHFAEAHLGQGHLDQALTWAERSLERAIAAEARLEEGCTRRVLGNIHRASGRMPEARDELEQSLAILQKLASPYQVALTQVQLAALCADLGDRAQAVSLRQQALSTFERLGAELDLASAKEKPGFGEQARLQKPGF